MEAGCPVCSSPQSSRGPRHYKRCARCRLLFAANGKAAESNWYERSWMYRGRPKAMPADLADGVWAWSEFFQAASLVDGEASLLDVGCGEGHFLNTARQRGFRVQGLDFNANSVEAARNLYGLPVVSQDLASYATGGQHFDYVTAFEFLEHTAEPVEVLRCLGRLASYIGISVPCADRKPPLFARGIDDPPHHLTLWTEEALRRAFSNAGLETTYVAGKAYSPECLAYYLMGLVGGDYPLHRYARGATRRLGRLLGRLMTVREPGPFTLFAFAKSTAGTQP
jgi:SAM-dependent methyltransferase